MEGTERAYISNDLIIKYLKKKLSESETSEVTAWLRSDQANQDFLFGLEELYQLYCWDDLKLAANTEREWEKLEKLIRSKKTPVRRMPVWKTFMKYAALVIGLGLITSYVLWQTRLIEKLQKPITVATAKGERSHVILPDGTKVWLNASSSVSYANAVFSKERRVKMKGEAYFEVTKDPHAPFIVESKKISTRVVGTKFNIRAYEDENYTIATLLEGSIQLTSSDSRFPRKIIMKPGEKIICYDENGEAQYVKDRKGNETIDWISGKLHFDNRTLETIARELEKRFDTSIYFAEDSLKQECFTCDFENGENLHQILHILRLTRKFDYEMKDRKIILYSVRK